jgi:hypothetical protein
MAEIIQTSLIVLATVTAITIGVVSLLSTLENITDFSGRSDEDD